jgi:hypothetical protein
MLRKNMQGFLRDESGGYTVWSLIWFSLYVAMGGLAVDITDAYRNQTLLQATADSSALAGALSLPDAVDAKDQAVAYSTDNMLYSVNGAVLDRDEVFVGTWNFATETFADGGADVNAVRVITRRDNSNGNPLAANFLRILSLWQLPFDHFNISAEAIATKYVPECLTSNALVAGDRMDVTSNNGFSSICIHGENLTVDPGHDYAVDVGNSNTFADDVQVSMPDLNDLNGKPNVCSNNPGLCDPGTLVEGDKPPKDAFNVEAIIDGLTNLDPAMTSLPGYMFDFVDANLVPILPPIVSISDSYPGPYIPGTIYVADQCQSNKVLNLPAGVEISKVVIVADCQIGASSGVILKDVVIASRSTGNGQDPTAQHSINFASSAVIGDNDFCTDSTGQVHLYSMASIHISAGPDVYGLRVVVAGDFEITANNDIFGISVQAADDITATANGEFSYCGGTFDGPFAVSYRLVR